MTRAQFEAVSRHLEDKGVLLRGGTNMDTTSIAASPSTEKKFGRRDPQMSQSKNGYARCFESKAHLDFAAKSELVHTAGMTTGKLNDAKAMDDLIRGDDRTVFAGKGYVNEKK